MTAAHPSWPAAVLFDFDGVIINSEPFHCTATRAVMHEHGMTLSERDYYDQLIGFDDRGGFRHLFELNHRSFDESTCSAVVGSKNRKVLEMVRTSDVLTLPGAADLIRRLASRSILGICSGALKSEIVAMLERVGLLDAFAVITSGEDVAVGKPDPSGYVQTMNALSESLGRVLKPADCLVVEDAPKVAANVRAIGFPVLGVTTSHPAAKWPPVDWLVDSLDLDTLRSQVPTLFNRLG